MTVRDYIDVSLYGFAVSARKKRVFLAELLHTNRNHHHLWLIGKNRENILHIDVPLFSVFVYREESL